MYYVLKLIRNMHLKITICVTFLYQAGFAIWENSCMHAQIFMWYRPIHLSTFGDWYYGVIMYYNLHK